MREPFLDREMSILLDLLRGLAAIAVLFGHAVQIGLYTGPWPFDQMLQHCAVIVFFVLSGIVIQSAAMRPGQSLREYVIARLTRVMPLALASIALSTSLYLALAPMLANDPYRPVATAQVALPAVFLSERWNPNGPVWNPPYWSLCYEIWFYALFGAWTFLRGGRRAGAIVVLAWMAGPRILLLLPIWLFGVAVARLGRPCLNRSVAWAALTLAVAIVALICTTGLAYHQREWLRASGIPVERLGYSSLMLTDLLLGSCVAVIFIGMRRIVEGHRSTIARLAKPARLLAGSSFSLYLLHWPVLSAMHALGLDAGENLARFVTLMLAPLSIAWIVSIGLERTLPIRLRRWFEASGPGASRAVPLKPA